MTEDLMADDDTPPEGGPTYTPPATQADLDRIVGERLARERAKFSDYEDVKTKAAKFDELEAATKSELQKAQDAIAERDAKLAELPRQARQQAIRFATVATTMGVLDPEDALGAIDVDLDDTEAVKTALEELRERKPHWFQPDTKKRLPARPKPEGSANGPDPDDPASLTGKERAAAALRQMRSTR